LFILAGCSSPSVDSNDPASPGAAQSIADKPTPAEASRFLQQATFGPTESDINALVSSGYSDWFKRQLTLSQTSAVTDVLAKMADYTARQESLGPRAILDFSYRAQIDQTDQLRQRMVFSLSQIIVTSIEDPGLSENLPAIAGYIDTLNKNAFGNYRDLLEEVTYSPAMAVYLTYLNNQKANAQTGSVPDENYAREVMQLFSIGLVELNPDGTPKTNAQGQQIETYTNADITGLAKVFTGLSWGDSGFGGRFPENNQAGLNYAPLKMWPSEHAPEEKTFLGKTIAAGTDGVASIDSALDTLLAHPNIAPFISKQLIQRFVTSNPSPQYVQRVANAFTAGSYVLPDRSTVGSKLKGDLAATLAAVLFDSEARDVSKRNDPNFGRVREPVLRFAHWARVADVNTPTILGENGLSNNFTVQESSSPDRLGQQQYRSPSVFNFYRPGYVASGTQSAAAGLVAPELQITTTNQVTGYANFMRSMIQNTSQTSTFLPSYADLIPLADRPDVLVDKLNLVMTANTLAAETRTKIVTALNEITIRTDRTGEDYRNRVNLAMLMITLSPEYAVLR
jgi:uncharacterized protein (DUF1800 family)